MDGLSLLAEARRAGLSVHVDGDKLVVRGPKSAAAIAQRLLAHKAEVMAALSAAPAPCSTCGCALGWRISTGRVACWFCESPPDGAERLILLDLPSGPRWVRETDEQAVVAAPDGDANLPSWDDGVRWDDSLPVCPTCGSSASWIDGLDGWHCLRCHPPIRAEKLLRDRERILQHAWRRLGRRKD